MSLDSLIMLDEVTKKYGSGCVLNNVSLTINKGDFIVLRGSNGSGKSTLLKLVSGLIPLTSGHRLIKQPSKLKIGYSPDRLSPLRMTSTEYLTHMGKISKVPKDKLKERINHLHELFKLEQSNKLNMSHFSKGMLQKLNLMQAMLVTPDILVLDEPFSGLDKESKNHLLTALQKINREGTAVLASVHDSLLSDIFQTKTYWLHNGNLKLDTVESSLVNKSVNYELILFFNNEICERLLSEFPNASCVHEHNMMHFTFPKEDYPLFLKAILEHEIEIISLHRRENQS